MADVADLAEQVLSHLAGDPSAPKLEEGKLDGLSAILCSLRTEAINGRRDSGIEEVWRKCEEAYLGIDDANRGTAGVSRWTKPYSSSGPLLREGTPGSEEIRSTVFVRLTSRYVDAGAAKMQEILLPVDDKAFSLEPTPVPDLIEGRKDQRPLVQDDGTPMLKLVAPPAGGAPVQAPMTVADLANQTSEAAEAAAKGAEKRIYDWMVESKHPAVLRKVIHDSSRIGTGAVKGPIPVVRERKALSKAGEGGAVKLEVLREVKPGEAWVDPWNLFPDPACGESIHDGDYIFEYASMAPKKVRELKKDPSYSSERLEVVLKEGPKQTTLGQGKSPGARDQQVKRSYDVWYFTGVIKRSDLASLNEKHAAMRGEEEEVFAVVTMINDLAVKAVLNPLESGAFPYHVLPWSRRAGHWAGVGPGEQCEVPQRILNASTRALLNNAGKSGGVQVVLGAGIEPADQSPVITPDKLWRQTPESIVDDVRKQFAVFQIPNVTAQMMTIVEYAFRLAEESTNIPLISQGQSGPTTPDTYGAAQLQNNNANQLLRAVGANFDDFINEPLVNGYYEMLLLDPDVPEAEKGDWTINAHGSAALVERAIQDQTLLWLGGLMNDPGLDLDKTKWVKEVLRSKRMSPSQFELSEADKAKKAQQPPPVAPQVQAAQVRAQTQEKVAALENQTEQLRIKRDTDRDTVYVQAETERTANERELRMEELHQRERLAMLDYANKNQISLQDIKAQLAEKAMTLNTQRELAGLATAADIHKHHTPQVATPAAEPPGRAEPGKAFEQ